LSVVRRLVIVIGFASVVVAPGLACATERSAQLVTSFQSFCTPGPPDFAATDARAGQMKLEVRRDTATQSPVAHTKSWRLVLASGSYELVAAEAHGPKGDAGSCGIGAEDVDGDDIKQELVRALNLGAPLQQSVSADGMRRLTSWKFGDEMTLFLADGTPFKAPGMYLSLVWQKITNR
jgi:hypothetical protein